MNIFTAAYEGMSEAVKTINENKEEGVVECQLCGRKASINDPYISTGWCFDCDEKMDEEWDNMWEDEFTPKFK